MTATPAEWRKAKIRHELYAKGKSVPLGRNDHNLMLPVLNENARGSGCCTSGNPAILDKDREILDTIRSGR